MGLFDSVLGAVVGSPQASAGNGSGLGTMGGLLSMVTSNPQLLQAVTGMLSNDGALGGLGGLIQKFQQAGLADVVGSWVGSGQNQPISGAQITNVLGPDALAGMAETLGMSPDAAASQFSTILPGLIDHLTPHGTAPQEGLGNAGDLAGMLGRLLR